MRFASFRRFLFQVHMWIGLVLGILFVALGLSGSILVYHDEIDARLMPTPQATAKGAALPFDRLVAIAKEAMPAGRANLLLSMPEEPGAPAIARFLPPQRTPGARPEGGERREVGDRAGNTNAPSRGGLVFIDPVSGKVLATRTSAMSPIVQFAHDMHGGLMMGRDGRPLVGWLGVGMVILGLTGLVLWWPKPHQWRTAFLIRRKAKGLRFHRGLHAAFGIWSFIVFIVVSFTGVAIAFPDTIRTLSGGGAAPAFNARTGPEVEPVDGVKRVGADEAAKIAAATVPNADVSSVMLPARRRQAISIAFTPRGGATLLPMVYVDPYRARVIASRNPPTLSGSDTFMAWQRPLHQGDGLGAVWRFLVFLSGFLPLLFVVTGVVMWVKKRRSRIGMNDPLPEGALS